MSSLETRSNDERWWRSLDELADSPRFRAFLEAEFPSEADPEGIDRRRWLQLMGASFALATAGGCRWKKQEILPFAKRPADRTPGKFKRFATAMPLGDAVFPLEVATVDGRPIKIDGNPRHPQSPSGASDVWAQAALLELYDPDRSREVVYREGSSFKPSTWDDFAKVCRERFGRLHESGGAGFCVLAEATSSPTLAVLREDLLKVFPRAKWFEYEPTGDDNARAGARTAFGRPLRTHWVLNRARVIVCLDADPLGSHPAAVRHARDFAAGRRPESGRMNRLYAVESGLSLTGAAADHRLALRASDVPGFAAALARRLAGKPVEIQASEASRRFFDAVADDLLAAENRGRSVVCAGWGQPPATHAAVHRMNQLLDNVGRDGTITYTPLLDADRLPYVEAISALVDEMNAGRVDTLVMLGGNPVYNAPVDLAFGETMAKVATTIHLSGYRDETSRRCTWHLPRAHFLETWGDGRAYDGTYSVIQPMIAPLTGGRSPIELMAMILADVDDPQRPVAGLEDLVRRTYREQIAGDSGPAWRQVVRDGLADGSQWPMEDTMANVEPTTTAQSWTPTSDTGPLDVVFRRDTSVHDGRFANSSWLQEWPDPLTKITWGNAALLGPATAERLGVKNETLVIVTVGGRRLTLPAYILPGQAAGTVSLALGYGRTAAGRVGGDAPDVEPVGVDVYPLRTSMTMDVATGATVEPTGRAFRLASTQDHWAIDAVGRAGIDERVGVLIRQATVEHYQEHPDFAQHVVHHPPLESLWKDPEYEGHRWGMSIDLSKCIGCGACVVACQAENNIPVVGRRQVLKGREMHWLRVDRYFRGDPNRPEVAFQPLPCQQCELAPCEQVCPVAATVHSGEGLNDMVYNRCVGTRYCANNCPYKVRRFNYFNFHKDLEDPANEVAKMKYNPQVTVRSRGVMEKCTYCVQRIQEAKIAAKASGGEIADGTIHTACQQACPAGAITFGDLRDKASEVRGLRDSNRAYAILAELNIRPRTFYLAKIRNPNSVVSSQ